MLLGFNVAQLGFVAFLHRRQKRFALLVGFFAVVAALNIKRHETGDAHGGAVGAEGVLAGLQIHGDRVNRGVNHLAGEGALPDQFIQPELLGLQALLNVGRGARRQRRAHRLVRLLRVFGFVFKRARLGRQRVGAMQFGNRLANFGNRLAGERDRVGAHVGDQPGAAVFQFGALV